MTRIRVREYAKEQWIPAVAGLTAQVDEIGRTLKATLKTRSIPLTVTGKRERNGSPELRLLAREITGVIPVGENIIEIQPKFIHATDAQSWREGLLAILAHTKGLEDLPRISGGLVTDSFVDLIGVVVASGLAQAVHDGLPRRYIERREDTTVLKGRLDANRLWRTSLDPTRMPVVYDEYSADTPALRLLVWAAASLTHSVVSTALRSQLEHLRSIWHDIPTEKPAPAQLDAISVPVQYAFLEDSIRAAKILASGEFLGVSEAEQENSLGFVWKTEAVFEEFVLAVCRAAAAQLGASADKLEVAVLVDPETGSQLKARAPGGDAVTGSPDVVVHRRGLAIAILDAKYKTLKPVSKASAGAPAASDVYQVAFYASQARLDNVALVYPAQAGFKETRHWSIAQSSTTEPQIKPRTVFAFSLDLSRMAGEGGFEALVHDMNTNLSILLKPT